MSLEAYDKTVANDCKSACITILDLHCESPYRVCASCKNTNKCHLSVKFAHDALVGVMGLTSTPSKGLHGDWKELTTWQKIYHTLHPNPHIYH